MPRHGCHRPGLTEGITSMRWKLTPEERFWAKVDRNGPVPEYRPDLGPCWLWLRYVDPAGYGRFCLNLISAYAHGVAYTWANGPVPKDLELDHLCRIRHCVRPDHLEAVTHQVNALRGEGYWAQQARRSAANPKPPKRDKTVCKRGHSLSPESGNLYTWRNHHGRGWACRLCRNALQRAKRARR
jgi:hypothetical protein